MGIKYNSALLYGTDCAGLFYSFREYNTEVEGREVVVPGLGLTHKCF